MIEIQSAPNDDRDGRFSIGGDRPPIDVRSRGYCMVGESVYTSNGHYYEVLLLIMLVKVTTITVIRWKEGE